MNTRLITRLAPIAAFIILVGFLAYGLTRDPKALPSQLIDREMPSFSLSELHDPQAVITQDDLKGAVSLVNVFGSWCVACQVEHPMLMQIRAEGSVQLVGINWRDTRPDAQAWLARHGDPYHRIAFDDESALAIELGVTGAPETFIVDQGGRIRYKFTGPITPEVWRDTILPIVASLAVEAG